MHVTVRRKPLGKGLGKVTRTASGVMSITPNPIRATSAHATDGRAVRSPRRHTTGLVGALNDDWRRLALDPSHRARIAGGRSDVPALGRLAVRAASLEGATTPLEGDELNGLPVLARSGDELPARTALQAMLGPVVRLARRTVGYADGDLEESVSRAVEAAWRVIRNYPV